MSELPQAIADKIDDLSERGNVLLDDQGDWRGAVAAWREALNLLPSPKTEWEAWTWLNASIGDALRQGGAPEAAKAALFDALNGPDAQTQPFVQFRLGQTLVDLGEADKGVEHLLRAYMLEGEEIFEEDGQAYLKLLRDRKLIS